jgi:hypothetical protein
VDDTDSGITTSSSNKVLSLADASVTPTPEIVQTAYIFNPYVLITKFPMILGGDLPIYIRVRLNGNADVGHIMTQYSGTRYLAKVRYIAGLIDCLFDNLNGIVTEDVFKFATPQVKNLRISLHDAYGQLIPVYDNQDWNFVVSFVGKCME